MVPVVEVPEPEVAQVAHVAPTGRGLLPPRLHDHHVEAGLVEGRGAFEAPDD